MAIKGNKKDGIVAKIEEDMKRINATLNYDERALLNDKDLTKSKQHKLVKDGMKLQKLTRKMIKDLEKAKR